ncbi:MAG TPA: hypothetical protein VFY48_02985 [Solirubrobacterales bacterium]|nr:hypothetical protein [Solirubrobacterales bacterium]
MQRTKKVVAALAAAMALVAIAGAPSAFAGYFSATAGSTGYTANSTAQDFSQPGGIVGNCASGGGFSGTVANLDEQLGAVPADMNCTSSSEGAVSWKWNGCKVTLQPGNDGSPLNGTFSIGGCGTVQVNSASCEKRISPQGGTATFTNEGGSVKATASANLSYTVVKAGGSCKNGTLTYTGKWNVAPSSGSLSALTSKVGISLEEGTFTAQTPAYPVNVSGGQDAADQHVLTLAGGRALKCATADLSGQLAGPSSTLALAPQYAGCAIHVGAGNLPATVNSSACDYQVAAAGTLGVACDSEADAIVITAFQNATKQAEGVPLCVYRVSSQSGVSGVGISNVGAGAEAAISLDFGVTNLAYSRVTGNAVNCGEAKANAAYQGTTVLSGVMD